MAGSAFCGQRFAFTSRSWLKWLSSSRDTPLYAIFRLKFNFGRLKIMRLGRLDELGADAPGKREQKCCQIEGRTRVWQPVWRIRVGAGVQVRAQAPSERWALI